MIKNIKIKSVSFDLRLGDIETNLKSIKEEIKLAEDEKVNILSFGENSLTGSSLYDAFLEGAFKKACTDCLNELINYSKDFDLLISISLPIYYEDRIYLCNLLIKTGEILSVVKKDNLKLQERGVFTTDDFEYVLINDIAYDIDPKQVLSISGVRIGVSIGEDEKSKVAKSLALKEASSQIIINPNAYEDYVLEGKSLLNDIRYLSKDQIYISTGANMGESSTDNAYLGLNVIAKDGEIIKYSRFNSLIYSIAMPIRDDYINFNNFDDNIKVDKFPYLPNKEDTTSYIKDVFDIAARGLITRMRKIGIENTFLGLSGGLDSTMAVLILNHAYEMEGLDKSGIHCYTMPGLGTSKKTKSNAYKLASSLNLKLNEIDISKAALDHLKNIGHDASTADITYENAQARERTQVLFDLANMKNGIVIGTGDLSEIMQGFATFNGDHMSNYSLNASLMKSELRFIISQYSKITDNDKLREVLIEIVNTPVSPELKNEDDSEIVQKTEDIIGPYELIDFFIYHHLTGNKSPGEIYELANQAFSDTYDKKVIKKWLVSYFKRFTNSQFKRSTSVDAVSVTRRSTSARLGFKIASDMNYDIYLREIDEK